MRVLVSVLRMKNKTPDKKVRRVREILKIRDTIRMIVLNLLATTLNGGF